MQKPSGIPTVFVNNNHIKSQLFFILALLQLENIFLNSFYIQEQGENKVSRQYSTVVFDLDGTLLDTLEDLQGSVNIAMQLCGFPSHTLEEIRNFVGNGILRLLELSVPEGKNNPKFNQALSAFQEDYKIHCNDKTKPYPGIIPLLEKLKADHIKMAIVSNKADFGVKRLQEIYFQNLVVTAIGQREPLKRKPAPDMVFEALKELGSNREETVYVGDSEVDLLTARNAGLPCISVTWGFRSREFLEKQGAKQMISSTKELEHILLS